MGWLADDSRVGTINKVTGLCAVLLPIVFLWTDVQIAQKRLVWYDEIGTLDLVKLPDLATFWQVQNSFRGDSAPALYVLLARISYILGGHADIAVRVMSALALIAALLIVFDCARRLSDGLHGLIALCIMATSFVTYYGYEGRSYTLAVLFTAVALWIWVHTSAHSKAGAAAFGAAIFAAVSMHFNSVLAMVPFGLWEVYRWRPWQRPSPKFVAGVIGLLCAVAIAARQVSIMSRVGPPSASSWSSPTVPALFNVLPQMFPAGLFLLAAVMILRCFMWGTGKPMANAEKVCWLFLTIPLAGFALAELVTKSFCDRYLITTLPGVAVGFACLVNRQLNRLAAIGLVLFLSVLAVGRQVRDLRSADKLEPPSAPFQQRETRQSLAVEDDLLKDGKRHVVAEHTVVRALQYYSKHPEMYVSYGPNDAPYFCQFLGDACWGPDMVKTHATEVASVYPTDSLLTMMTEAGFQTTIKRMKPLVVYFSPKQ